MKPRKPNRLKEYNYSQNNAYFITICTRDKENTLCSIVRGGVLDAPCVQLSKYGKIVNETIIEINNHYSHLTIDKYVIMPNHVHLIIMVTNNNEGTSGTPSRTNQIIPALVSTLKRFTNKQCGKQMWHRSYHDYIIRNYKSYQRIWYYIDTNPYKWERDCFYKE